jgi:AAA domain-containing protein
MNIPAALTARPAWVVWKYENGTKVPYSAKTGHKASSTKESTWTTFDVAFKVAQGRGFDGVGFVFSEDDPFTGIDLDDCRDDAGGIADWAMEIVTSLESYTEVSPSGHGLKIWVEGSVPTAVKQPYETGKIEIYSTARYFTVTGQHLEGTPSGIRNANGALTALYEKLKPPKAEPQFRPAPSNRDEHAEAWARKKLAKAIEMVTLSVDGHKDDTLLAAARLAAGALPHISEWEIETALFSAIAGRATDSDHARKTIRNGIRYGEDAPLALPPPPPQPVFDEYGRACCPVHRMPLPKANNGNGYKCRQRDPSTPTGWCAFWWSGEGYSEPADRGNAAAPDSSARAIEPVGGSAAAPTNAPIARLDASAPLFRLYRMDDLRQLPPVQWLIPNEVPAGLLTVLCGPSEAGKSFIALDYAISVARAEPDRMVVYVAPEGGSGYRARVDAWVSHHGGEEPKNLVFVLRDVPMLDLVSVHAFVEAIKQDNPVLIILDTLARCMVGGDENSAEDMGLFIHSCDLIRAATSAAVIIVHHTGKSGGYRGSSVLYGSCDSWIDVSNDDGLITVSCGKAKDWQRFDPRYLRMAPKDESVVLMPAEQVGRGSGLTDGQRKVLEVLALDVFREAGAKSAQIKSTADQMPDKTLFRVLSHLKRNGFVNQGRRGDPYTITFKGLQEIKAYHRALREQRDSSKSVSDAVLSPTVNLLPSTPDTEVMSTVTTVTTPLKGGVTGSMTGEEQSTSADDLFPDEDDPLLPLPASQRFSTKMMLVSALERNQEMARERCEEYGIDFEEARDWARGCK